MVFRRHFDLMHSHPEKKMHETHANMSNKKCKLATGLLIKLA